MTRRRVDITVAALFLLFLAAPTLARLLGVREVAIENRELAAAPEPSATALLDPEFFEAFSRYFTDHLPLRARLVRLNSWIDYHWFEDSSSPSVLMGRDGWLFLADSVEVPCHAAPTLRHLLETASQLDGLLREAGIDFLFYLAPNKSAIYPEYLPERRNLSRRRRECITSRRVFRSALTERGAPWLLDLWAPLASARRDGLPVFSPLARHGNPDMAVVTARELVRRIRPQIWNEASIIRGEPRERLGELAYRFMQLAILEAYEEAAIDRPRVTVTAHSDAAPVSKEAARDGRRFTTRRAGAPVIRGTTVVFHDSFIGQVDRAMAPYFEEIVFLPWSGLRDHARVAELIGRADRVVIEKVEDEWYKVVRTFFDPGLQQAIRDELEAKARSKRGAEG